MPVYTLCVFKKGGIRGFKTRSHLFTFEDICIGIQKVSSVELGHDLFCPPWCARSICWVES